MPDGDLIDRIVRKSYETSMRLGTGQGVGFGRTAPRRSALPPIQVTEEDFPQEPFSIPGGFTYPTQKLMSAISQRPDVELLKLPPGMDKVLLDSGVSLDLVNQFRTSGVPKELLEQLPPPQTPGFWERVMSWTPARKVAKGIDYATKPFQWVNENVDKPWASMVLWVGEQFQGGDQEIERNIKQYGWWGGLRKGYEEKDISKWGKFGLELSNPLWWIPVSVWASGAKLAIKGLAGAEAANRAAVASSLAATKITSATLKPFMKVPGLRTLIAESPHSMVVNAPSRTFDMAINSIRAYEQKGMSHLDFLDDLIKGELAEGVNVKDLLANPYHISALDDILKKSITNKAGQEVDVSDILRLNTIKKMAMKEVDEFKSTGKMSVDSIGLLSANMKRAYETAYGFKLGRGEGLFYDTYQFWRGAVLWTPVYMLQNVVENNIRALIHTRGLPVYRNLSGLANSTNMPVSMKMRMIAQKHYISSSKDAVDAARRVNGLIKEEEAHMVKLTKAGRSIVASQHRLNNLEADLAELPNIPKYLHPTANLSTEAVIAQGGRQLNQFEKTMVKVFTLNNHLAFNKTWATRLASFPFGVANYMDAALLARGFQYKYNKITKSLLSIEDLGKAKLELANTLDKTNHELWKSMGLTDDEIQQTIDGFLQSRNDKDLAGVLANLSMNPYPKVMDAIDSSTLPDSIKPILKQETRMAWELGDVEGIKDSINRARRKVSNSQRAFTEEWGKSSEELAQEQLKLLPEPYRTEIDGLLEDIERVMKDTPSFKITGDTARAMGVSDDVLNTQLMFWADIFEREEKSRIITNYFLEKSIKQALTPTGIDANFLAETRIRLQEARKALSENYRKVHPELSTITQFLPKKGKIPDDVWEAYVSGIEKLRPEFVGNLRNMPHTRDSAWINYYTVTSYHFSKEPEIVAQALGMDLSVVPDIKFKNLLDNYNSELDNIEQLAIQVALNPQNTDKYTSAIVDMGQKMYKAFDEHSDTILGTEKVINEAQYLAENFAYMLMGNYAKTRGIDELLRPYFPFFYFPSRSIPFYMRTGIEYPWTLRALWGYDEATKEPQKPESLIGYFRVPGTKGVYVNPLRPFMGYQILGEEPLAGLGQPVAEQAMTALSMLGLSVSPGISLSMELGSRISETTGGPSLTRGEPRAILPQLSWLKNSFQLASGKEIPEPTQMLLGLDSQPAWFRRNLEKELAAKGIDPVRAFGPNATPDDKAAITDALRAVSAKSLSTILAPMRYRHPEEIQKTTDLSNALELYGISKDQQTEIREMGLSPTMFINNFQKRQLMAAHPEWEPWLGLTSPFISPKERKYWEDTKNFWIHYEDTLTELEKQQIEDSSKADLGLLSPAQWRENYQKRQEQKATAWDMLSKIYSKSLTSEKTRVEYRRDLGRPLPPIHVEDRAVSAYYSIQPPVDPITRKLDFNEFQVQRDTFLNAMPDWIREYIVADTERPRLEQDHWEKEWRQDRRKLRVWNMSKYNLLQQYPQWKTMLDTLTWASSADPVLARQIQKSTQYKQYQKALRDTHESLLLQDAELEYILHRWGILGPGPLKNPETINFVLAGSSVVKSPLTYPSR